MITAGFSTSAPLVSANFNGVGMNLLPLSLGPGSLHHQCVSSAGGGGVAGQEGEEGKHTSPKPGGTFLYLPQAPGQVPELLQAGKSKFEGNETPADVCVTACVYVCVLSSGLTAWKLPSLPCVVIHPILTWGEVVNIAKERKCTNKVTSEA